MRLLIALRLGMVNFVDKIAGFFTGFLSELAKSLLQLCVVVSLRRSYDSLLFLSSACKSGARISCARHATATD
jgi:hypothetical protein